MMRKIKKYWPSYGLPGLGLIGLAFWAGAHPNLAVAFLGFLSFFVVGVTLLKEGRKKIEDQNNSDALHPAESTSKPD